MASANTERIITVRKTKMDPLRLQRSRPLPGAWGGGGESQYAHAAFRFTEPFRVDDAAAFAPLSVCLDRFNLDWRVM